MALCSSHRRRGYGEDGLNAGPRFGTRTEPLGNARTLFDGRLVGENRVPRRFPWSLAPGRGRIRQTGFKDKATSGGGVMGKQGGDEDFRRRSEGNQWAKDYAVI